MKVQSGDYIVHTGRLGKLRIGDEVEVCSPKGKSRGKFRIDSLDGESVEVTLLEKAPDIPEAPSKNSSARNDIRPQREAVAKQILNGHGNP